MKKAISGFTIVEILIVIAVIAILASITLVSYNIVQTNAKAVAVENGLKDIEKALRVYGADEKWATWPKDNQIDGKGTYNPSIQTIIDNQPDFKQYLNVAPTTSDLPASAWTYDNDGDSKSSSCSGTHGESYNGTNLVLTGVPSNIYDKIDADMDDGDPMCGIIRYDPTPQKLFYALSYSNSLE